MRNTDEIRRPDCLSSYFCMEWKVLLLVTLSGIFYNVGLVAGPWFEGHLVQGLLDVFNGKKNFYDILRLAGVYVAAMAAVQTARYLKRLYVRHFANHVNRNMKQVLYGNLIHCGKAELERQNIGNVMTKAISDVDDCVEGMRKFTTEIFDTGIALLGYAALLLWYDWRLALLSLIFPPVSYVIAEKMKRTVQRSGAEAKESRGRLNEATLDRVSGAAMYRIFGCEPQRSRIYEQHLDDYERKAARANIWVAAMTPLYQLISMAGVGFILYFGGKNVTGSGWSSWNIAAFTTFLSCFTKLSVKSSKAAKLFNAVHKAEVSWKRIKPLMKYVEDEQSVPSVPSAPLDVENLGVSCFGDSYVFQGLSLHAVPGQIIGVTGPVACGKSTFGRAFLCENLQSGDSASAERMYRGSIRFGGRELAEMTPRQRCGVVGYLGHDPELMSDTIRRNILLGEEKDLNAVLDAVCLREEAAGMASGLETKVGSGGIRLSGGQQARLALARTLAHPRPLLILDDPFSALDRRTELEVYTHLRELAKDSIVILISHRLYLFPQLDQVIWMENGKTETGTHEELLKSCVSYASLYELQKGDDSDAKQ